MRRSRTSSPTRLLTVLVSLAAVAALTATSAPASAARRHEPRLAIGTAQARAAMTCSGDPRRGRRPVLFLHGTTSNARANWSWNWNRAFDLQRRAYCDVDVPESGNGDISLGAQYVVRAIEILHRRAGRRISLVGHSQGGMIARWSLKYWPHTRRLVDDYVGLSSSNHGTQVFDAECTAVRQCTAAQWQQRTDSRFLAALDRGPETYPGISYTEISTTYDDIVVPSTSPYLSGPARRVTNVSVQQLCPGETVDHFGMAYDNAAWLIGTDALDHRGPARLARVSRATCGRPTLPGVDPVAFPGNLAMALQQTAVSSATARQYDAEPALPAYAR